MSQLTVPVLIDPITAALGDPRPRRQTVADGVRHLRAELDAERAERRQITDLYAGGLPAEIASRKLLRTRGRQRLAAKRAEVRAMVLSRVGRRIDLPALLRELRPDGFPRWALIDPAGPAPGQRDRIGQRDTDGTVLLYDHRNRGTQWVKIPGATYTPTGKFRPVAYTPTGGIPPLPPAARRLATDKKIRRRAKWVGLLYQPDEWTEVRPDPAIIVEWIDRPGEYYALAVWGGDRARIMEFVD